MFALKLTEYLLYGRSFRRIKGLSHYAADIPFRDGRGGLGLPIRRAFRRGWIGAEAQAQQVLQVDNADDVVNRAFVKG